jgi:hypothetical protein
VAGSDPAAGSQRRPAHRSSIALSAVPHAPVSNCCSAEWRARSKGHRPQNKIPASCPTRRSRSRHDRKAKRAGVEGDLALVSMKGGGRLIRPPVRPHNKKKKESKEESKRTREATFSMRKPRRPPFTNASIAVLTHSWLTNGLWSVVRFGSRCGKDGARRGIARSQSQKFSPSDVLRSESVASSLRLTSPRCRSGSLCHVRPLRARHDAP